MVSIKDYLKQLIRFLKKHLGKDSKHAPFYILIAAMLLIFIGGMNVFLELAEGLRSGELGPYDKSIQEWIIQFRDPQLTPLVTFITDLGDRWAYFVVIGVMGIVLLFRKKWWLVGQVLFVSGLSALATIVLKNEYQRQRPAIEHLVEIGGLSFPSGHSLSAMAFYGFVIYLIFRFIRSDFLRISLSLLCALLILSIGVSRIYLGVHYPTDVAAGFAGGIIWASFCIILFNLIELWRKRRRKRKRASQLAEE